MLNDLPAKIKYGVLVILFGLGLTPKLHAQSRLQQWDDNIMIDFVHSRTPEKTAFFHFVSDSYRYGDIGVPASLFVIGVVGDNHDLRQNSAYIASSTAISYGLMLLIKHFVKRPRPFISNINIVPVYRAQGFSFPSGHASTTFSTATALSIAYPKWYVIAPAFLWAGTVSYSRMYLGEHYPTDVAAGAFIGAASAFSMKFMSRPH